MMDENYASWQEVLDGCREYGSFAANRFLAMMAGESDDDFEDALLMLTDKEILLDISDIHMEGSSRLAAARLNLEKKLVQKKITLRDLDMNDPLRLFLQEVRKMPRNADFAWAEAMDYLNDAERERIAEDFLPRVAEAALSLAGKGVPIMDLVQEGSLGLWQGLAFWEGQSVVKYLDRRVRMAMHQAIVSQARAEGLGDHLRKQMIEFKNTDSKLLGTLGRNPTVEEIAYDMGIPLDVAEELQKMVKDAAGNPVNTEPEEENTEEELEVDGTAYYQSRQRVNDLMSGLTREEQQLLNMRFGLETGKPMDAVETARILGITPEEVLVREAQALAKMRNAEE